MPINKPQIGEEVQAVVKTKSQNKFSPFQFTQQAHLNKLNL
jgi:hypothetical protein